MWRVCGANLRVIAPADNAALFQEMLQTTLLFSKKCCSGGEQLEKLCPISPAGDLNLSPLSPPAPETTALPLYQLAGR